MLVFLEFLFVELNQVAGLVGDFDEKRKSRTDSGMPQRDRDEMGGFRLWLSI
jgi:hypothetical protein